MSRKSKKKAGERYIKCVETIPPDKYKDIPVFQSIMKLYREYKPTYCKGDDLTFVFQHGGELKERSFREICCSSSHFNDSWCDGTMLKGVKLVYSDGTWEYGFKYWHEKGIVQKPNSVLVSLFLHTGVVNEEEKTLDDCLGLDKDSRIPAWMRAMIPMYNERVRDAVENNDDSIETDLYTLKDFERLRDVMGSSYVLENAHYSDVELKTGTVKMPIGLSFNKEDWWMPFTTTWKDKVCNVEWGEASTLFDRRQILVNVYAYFKSIYVNKVTRRRVYGVFPLSDLFMIKKRNWNDKEREWEEVWNNLDQTVVGNI